MILINIIINIIINNNIIIINIIFANPQLLISLSSHTLSYLFASKFSWLSLSSILIWYFQNFYILMQYTYT